MVEVEFADFNPGPHGDPDDQDEHGPLSELLAKHDQGDFLRSVAEAVLQADHGGGCRRPDRRWQARAQRRTHERGVTGIESALSIPVWASLNLRVPKLRPRQFTSRGFLEARKTSEQALVAVIQEAWISGVLDPVRRR